MPVSTAHDTVAHLLRLTAEGPAPATADLFSADAVFEMPFLPPGAPEPAPGRETFRAHLESAVGLQRFDALDEVLLHRTDDPEVVVAEYRLHGVVLPTGRRFAHRLVMVARVRDCLVTHCRTYANPLDTALAFGTAEALLSGLTEAEPVAGSAATA